MNHDSERLKKIIENLVCDAQMLRWNGLVRSEYTHERPVHVDRMLRNIFGSRNGLNDFAETMIAEGFTQAVTSGENIDIGLEYLKDKAGMPNNTMNLATDNSMHIDFSYVNIAGVDRLETGIAVYTRKGMKGTLSHLSIRHPIDDFLRWLDQSPSGSRVHLVGGHEYTGSEGYLDSLRKGIESRGFRISGEDVLSEQEILRRVRMRTSGLVEVEHYREQMVCGSHEEVIIEMRYLI